MSRVIVRPLNILGGLGPVTSFSDNFNRANSTQGFGANWLYGGFQVQTVFANIGPVGIDNQQATFQATGVNQNIQVPINWFAVPPMSGLNSKSQFVQFTYKSNNSVFGTRQMFIGGGVLGGYVDTGAGSDYREYLAWVEPGTGGFTAQVHLARFDNGAFTDLALAAGAVADDVFRMNARINAGNVTLEIFRNGVSVLTQVDNNANRATTGTPFMGRRMWVSGAAPGTGDARIDDFSCGIF